ncbi:snapalysin family zinc-dependent metalloprotease [Streptomyces lavendulocolor]|uniref:snapalysin family zinc-dependent metalloprotease n=1 Tax=Streptomyces lavendulocolor TaxID=67316 RepID=UPI0033EAE25E
MKTEPSAFYASGRPYIFFHDATGDPRMSRAIDQAAATWNRKLGYAMLVETANIPVKGITITKDASLPHAGLATTCDSTSDGMGMNHCDTSTIKLNDVTVRIAAHEFGHTLGLAHTPIFHCSTVMNGIGTKNYSTKDPACGFPSEPNIYEVSAVKRLYGVGS